jgi:ABC-2 type transport system ATP-binding protein
MKEYAIDMQGVTRRFGDTLAVDALSLTVEVGEVFGFLGHNGAGKTTTVRLLNGVLTADRGQIRVMGLDPRTEGSQLRARTGVLTETPSLDERLTAVDNLSIYAELYGVPSHLVQQRVNAALEEYGLAERAREKVGGYSRGMKQRLALARVFLHEPETIFLDEPTSGLDPIAIQDVHKMIRHVSHEEGRTVFLCTHNLVEAQRLCDRVAVIERGHLVVVGSPYELAQDIGAKLRYSLEVAADQQAAACRIIEEIASVTSIESTSPEITITLKEREAVPEILMKLVHENIRVYALTPHQTSLEDIYMALHQGKGHSS